MKKIKSIILVFLIAGTTLFGQIGVEDNLAHKETPLFFDNNTTGLQHGSIVEGNGIEQNGESMIGNDTLPDNNISTGTVLKYRMGKSSYNLNIDESGNPVIYDQNGTKYNPYANSTDNEKLELKSLMEEYKAIESQENNSSAAPLTKEEKMHKLFIKDQLLHKLKIKQLAQVEKMNGTVKDRLTKYGAKASASGGSSVVSIFTQDTENLEYKKDNGQELTSAEENELNATKFYKKYYGNAEWNRKEHMTNETNTSLGNAFSDLSAIEQSLTNRLTSGKIQCQISRNLVPTYFCPLPNKNNLRFPATSTGGTSSGLNRVDIAKALKECNDYCISEPGFYPTVKVPVLSSKTFNIPNDNFELFPNYDTNKSKIILNSDDRMPLAYIEFKISIPKPTDSNITDQEWNKQLLKKYQPKFKFDLIGIRDYTLNEGTTDKGETFFRIYDKMVVNLTKASMLIRFPINKQAKRYELKIYKPYLHYPLKQNEFANLTTIHLDAINSKYMSDSYYYCIVKQFVPFPSYCFGGRQNTVHKIVKGQDMYLCKDREHKIGPESLTGGFFSEARAKAACRIKKPCKTTYTSGVSGALTYNTKITCLDNIQNNKACNDTLCNQLFRDQKKDIVNEMIIGLSKDKVDAQYTIRNGTRTDLDRPKINFSEVGRSTLTNSNYNSIFNTEEKDSAYKYMIKNITYNRFKYRIGEESPARVAYNLFGSEFNKGLNGILKPASFDYVNPNTFYVYAVAATNHMFFPRAGSWFINGQNIVVTNSDNNSSNLDEVEFAQQHPKFMDRTYSIKTGPGNEDWQVFRRIKNYKFYQVTKRDVFTEDPNTGSKVPGTTIDRKWIDIPAYKVDKFEKYDSVNDKFKVFSKSQEAPYFTTKKFTNADTFYKFNITNNISATRMGTPGLLIRSQEIINNDTSYRRIYKGGYKQKYESDLYDTSYWLLYSDHKLTYDEIMINIEGSDYKKYPLEAYESKWSLYDIVKYNKYNRDKVPDDGELNNNIRVFKKGTPGKMTFYTEWIPIPSEKGKKVFKFTFLFTDQEIKNFNYTNH